MTNISELFKWDSVDDFVNKISFFTFGLVYLLVPVISLVWIVRNKKEIKEQFHWYRIQENCKMLNIEDETIHDYFPLVIKYGTFFESIKVNNLTTMSTNILFMMRRLLTACILVFLSWQPMF